MAVAFELTRPELKDRFAVTVYQMGWRLGGKGASGRGPAARIEEHGLHLWMGFYENAFRLMRECYQELDRDPRRCRITQWTDAFAPASFNAVTDLSPSGHWLPWRVLFPSAGGMPGDPISRQTPWTVTAYLARCVSLLRTLVRSTAVPAAGDTTVIGQRSVGERDMAAELKRLLRYAQLVGLEALSEALAALETVMAALPRFPAEQVTALVGLVSGSIRQALTQLVKSDDELRRLWEIADLILAVLRGAMRFRLATHPMGFDAINDYDCREWLRLNGASQQSVDSAFVRALYDLAFAYEDGDVARPRIAAGQALRGALRAFFTYRGAFFWKMRAGMGDAVFAPFFQVLKRRGVRFEFFHRLERLRLGRPTPGQRPFVDALDFDVQATVSRSGGYRPLMDVRGLPCWPSVPDFRQLVDGDDLKRRGVDFESPWETRGVRRKTLRVGEDFDFVVLAVGLGAVPTVAQELIRSDPRWRAMTTRVKSVPTQAFQIWLKATTAELGWRYGATNVSGFVEPFDTWADMSHLSSEEAWPEEPRSIAYFCSVLPDRGGQGRRYQRQRATEVKRNAIKFMNGDLARLWPNAHHSPGQFRWELLASAEKRRSGPANRRRFNDQYWRANVAPSDRYSLSLPGSLRYRISPLDGSYSNMTVAGDWTDCGFNEGCVEAAVMSGRLAAHALAQSPSLDDIVGFDHP